jgi:hypothetical protein
LATGVIANYTAYLAPHCHVGTTLTSLTVTDLSDPAAAISVQAAAADGGLGGDELPASCAMLVNFKIKRRYRGGKPRIYVPTGVGGNLATPQTWSPTFLSAWSADFQNLLSNIVNGINAWGSGAALVNVSYYLGGEWKADQNGNYHRVPTARSSPHVDQVVSHAASSIIGQQRRRVRAR